MTNSDDKSESVKMLKSVAAAWESFSKKAVPSQASNTQRDCMKAAFYAGFIEMFGQVTVISESSISEEDACKHLDALKAEIILYSVDVAEKIVEFIKRKRDEQIRKN